MNIVPGIHQCDGADAFKEQDKLELEKTIASIEERPGNAVYHSATWLTALNSQWLSIHYVGVEAGCHGRLAVTVNHVTLETRKRFEEINAHPSHRKRRCRKSISFQDIRTDHCDAHNFLTWINCISRIIDVGTAQ